MSAALSVRLDRGVGRQAQYGVRRSLTLAEHRQRFAADMARALHPVLERSCHVDTVQVLLPRRLAPSEVAALRRMSPGAIFDDSKSLAFPFLVRLRLPSKQAIAFLSKSSPDHLVNRIDVAFDLSTAGYDDARNLHAYLSKHMTQAWRGNRKMRQFRETTYFAKAWQGRNMAVYVDKSKITGAPVCHVEFRYYSARVCGSIGVRQLRDLRDFDALSLMRRHTRLSALIRPKVLSVIDGLIGAAVLIHNRRNKHRITRTEMARRYSKLLAYTLRDSDEGSLSADLMDARVQKLLDRDEKDMRQAVLHLPSDVLFTSVQRR